MVCCIIGMRKYIWITCIFAGFLSGDRKQDSLKNPAPTLGTLVDTESSVHKTPKERQPLNQIYTFLISEIFTQWNLYTIPFVKNSVFKCPLQIQRTSNSRSQLTFLNRSTCILQLNTI